MTGLYPSLIEIVRRRIDELGTTEPVIQRQGEDRIFNPGTRSRCAKPEGYYRDNGETKFSSGATAGRVWRK